MHKPPLELKTQHRVQFYKNLQLLCEWVGINRKQSTMWQRLFRLKASAFLFSLQKKFSFYKTQQLILGTGIAIWWLTEPHYSAFCYVWNPGLVLLAEVCPWLDIVTLTITICWFVVMLNVATNPIMLSVKCQISWVVFCWLSQRHNVLLDKGVGRGG